MSETYRKVPGRVSRVSTLSKSVGSTMRCASEGELCDRFSTIARANGWRVFPEVGGWDLLLVCNKTQIGIEAKMQCNIRVLVQAMRRSLSYRYPDYRAVLVPKASFDLIDLCRHLKILVFDLNTRVIRVISRYDLKSKYPLVLPAVPLQSGGGRPAPRSLTTWRQNALRLCHLLRAQGYVTGKDFNALGLNRQNWIKKWVDRSGHVGGHARYVARSGVELPDAGYERERDLIIRCDSEIKRHE